MHYLDTTTGKRRTTRLVLSALRAASRNRNQIAFTCAVSMALPLGANTAMAKTVPAIASTKSTFIDVN